MSDPCVITVVREAQPVVTADCGSAVVNIANEVVNVYAGETGLQGPQGTPGIGGATWGGISGSISNQTDLQAELDAKITKSKSIAFAIALGG
jgi:hypothetical protein